MIFDRTATIKRLTGTGKKTFEQVAETPCHLQPFTDENASSLEGTFGKDFLMVCPDIALQEGDRVEIEEQTYQLIGFERLEGLTGRVQVEARIRIFV